MSDPSDTLEAIRARIEHLSAIDNELCNRDFLLTWQQTDSALRSVLLAAEVLQQLYAADVSTRVFDTGLGLSIFRDKSTRTRYSFRAGCNLLGLMTEELDESSSQIAHGETVRETATMISFCSEVVGIRDDIYLGEGHRYMSEFAASLGESYAEGALAQRPAVINLQCDLDHPTQSLSDLRHLISTFGSLEALRGKRIAMTWAYSPSYGKPLSVPQGIITLMSRFGLDVVLAHPPGYELVDETVEVAREHAAKSGGAFTQVDSLADAFEGADVVYPKSWAPAWVMKDRTELLRAGETGRLAQLERDCLANNAKFRNDWECTDALMQRTRDAAGIYMHCLPADITGVSCDAGEVSKDVFDRHRLATYREAGHKPFVIAAMVLCTRFDNPAAVLRALVDRKLPRRFG